LPTLVFAAPALEQEIDVWSIITSRVGETREVTHALLSVLTDPMANALADRAYIVCQCGEDGGVRRSRPGDGGLSRQQACDGANHAVSRGGSLATASNDIDAVDLALRSVSS
jgi:hypothetical protein